VSLLSFPLPRLNSLLVQLPLPDGPGRLLDVGCGDCPAALTLRHALPGWTIYGLDLDPGELRRAHLRAADLRLICADASHLPGLLRQRFGLILVRHPDLSLRRRAWSRIIPRLPLSLAPGGVLLITLYTAPEADLLRGLPLPPPYPLDESALAPVDLGGRDRFAAAYRAAAINPPPEHS